MKNCPALFKTPASELTYNSDDSEVRLRKSPPPPFFRNCLIILLVLFGTGCEGLYEHCDSGFWERSPADWLNLFIQSGVVGFVLVSIVSVVFYRLQLNKLREWNIAKSPNPPSLPSAVIWILLVVILLLPLIVVFLSSNNCSMSWSWALIFGIWVGSLLSWWAVRKFYYLHNLKKYFKN